MTLTDTQKTILATVMLYATLLAFSCIHKVQAQEYRPDHIDIERMKDWRATHCDVWGNCRWRRHWHRYRYAPRIVTPDPELKWAQGKLQSLGYELEDDGLMGPETREAIERFQRRNDLDVTGTLGPRTLTLLGRHSDRDGRLEKRHEDGRRDCKSWEHGIGKETRNVSEAQGTAQSNWMERVKFKYGIRYSDPVWAQEARFICSRS